MRHPKIGEIAPVLGCAADLHVAQHDAAQVEGTQGLQELTRTREQRHAWRSGRTQGAADIDDVCVPARDAEALEGSAQDSVGVLDHTVVVLAERGAEGGQRLRGLHAWQEAGELRKTPIVGRLPCEAIGPQGAPHVDQYRPQHWLH